jgi:hypothetical protein
MDGRLLTNELNLTVVQDNREVSGTGTTESGAGTVAGTLLSPTQVTFRITQTRPWPADFSGIGTISGRTLGGSYGELGCAGPFRATFSVTRQ